MLLQYLIAGLGTVVCRHGSLVALLNMFEGERHAYAIVALEELRKQGVVPNIFWYDINCRWAGQLYTPRASSRRHLSVPLLATRAPSHAKHAHCPITGGSLPSSAGSSSSRKTCSATTRACAAPSRPGTCTHTCEHSCCCTAVAAQR
jgi:hypothetical protein